MPGGKKILITGASGLLGRYLLKELSPQNDVFAIGRKLPADLPSEKFLIADLTDFSLTYQKITRLNPDLIIHCAAMSDVDECERRPDDAFRLNSLVTRNIAISAQRFDAEVLYISTDYVFGGRRTTALKNRVGFSELDRPKPLNTYGWSKYWGEIYIRDLLSKFFIVRSSWFFGVGKNNFVWDMYQKLNSNQEILATKEMTSIPTYVKDLARAIGKLVETSAYGIYHLTNSKPVSRYDFAIYLARYLQKPETLIREVTLKDLKLAALRPQFSALDNYNWYLQGFSPLRPWMEALKDYLLEIKNNQGNKNV